VQAAKDPVRTLHISRDSGWAAMVQCVPGLFQLQFVGSLERSIEGVALNLSRNGKKDQERQ
jgi:hypothetical protein